MKNSTLPMKLLGAALLSFVLALTSTLSEASLRAGAYRQAPRELLRTRDARLRAAGLAAPTYPSGNPSYQSGGLSVPVAVANAVVLGSKVYGAKLPSDKAVEIVERMQREVRVHLLKDMVGRGVSLDDIKRVLPEVIEDSKIGFRVSATVKRLGREQKRFSIDDLVLRPNELKILVVTVAEGSYPLLLVGITKRADGVQIAEFLDPAAPESVQYAEVGYPVSDDFTPTTRRLILNPGRFGQSLSTGKVMGFLSLQFTAK